MTLEMPPDLSSRQLRAVLALVEYRSFIAAAAFLRVSQPALTRTIKQVESALGVALFVRTTRQVGVTQAGREFAALAARLLNDLKISVGSLRKHATHPSGQIIVSSVLSLAGAVLPELLADFGRRYPGFQIHLREGIHRDVVDDVRGGIADFGIGYLEGLPDTFIVEDLGVEKFHVVLPASHRLARSKRVAIEDLEPETFVSFPPESRSRQIADRAAAQSGFGFRYAMTVNRLPTLLALVRNGIGIAILPASESRWTGDQQVVSRPLQGAHLSCRLGVMRSRERELTPAAAILLVVMRRWLRDLTRARVVTRSGSNRSRKA
jgi:DNA-binding transcriptional LysR family regulator